MPNFLYEQVMQEKLLGKNISNVYSDSETSIDNDADITIRIRTPFSLSFIV